jgi:glycosyl transferase family 87
MTGERSTATVALACSAASILSVATVAAAPGSPLQPVLPEGAGPSGPFAALARQAGLDAVHGSAAAAIAAVAMAFAAAAFLFVLREARRGRVSVRSVVVLAVVAHVAVLTLPLLVSRDVYSYAAYGRITALHHANPYVQTPADFPADPVVGLVGPKWASTPAVYGPLFTTIAAGFARAFGSLPALIEAFRVLAVLASLGTLAAIALLARRLAPERVAFAVAIFGLNPVVLFQSVASGHNDVLVALSVAGALALVVAGRDGLAVAALALGTLVKVTAAFPLLLVLVWIVARRPAGRRARAAVGHVGIAAAIGLAFAIPYLQTQDPTLGMAELAGHEGWLAPSRLFRRVFDAVSGDALGWVARFAFAVLLVLTTVAIARHLARRRPGPAELGAAWGWALLALMMLGPVLLPWYIAWTLPLAVVLPRIPRIVLLVTSTALAVSQWAAEPTRFPSAYDANVIVGHYVLTPVIVVATAFLLSDLRRRLVEGAPLADSLREVPTGDRDRGDDRRTDGSDKRQARALERDRDEREGAEPERG